MSYSVEINSIYVKIYKSSKTALKYAQDKASRTSPENDTIRVWQSGEGVVWENS